MTICSNCQRSWQSDTESNCPVCAYPLSANSKNETSVVGTGPARQPQSRRILSLLVVVALAWVISLLIQFASDKGGLSDSEWKALAATVRPGEVVMYSTTDCVYCQQAEVWLKAHNFHFSECNMTVEPRCEAEFHQYGATGTPFLVVRRGGRLHLMRNGFDHKEFLGLLLSRP